MRRIISFVLVPVVFFVSGRLTKHEPASAQEEPRECAIVAGDLDGVGDPERPNVGDAVHLLRYLFLGEPAPRPFCQAEDVPRALPATGQTNCHDTEGNPVDCDSAEWPGQDGFYRTGCGSDGRFIDHGDGTVTDSCTGLMWQKETAPGEHTWQSALQYCDGLELAGHTDWRLPNIRELQSIVDYGRAGPSIDPVFQAARSWYWSSSGVVHNEAQAWGVHFHYGGMGGSVKSGPSHARAVRGGP